MPPNAQCLQNGAWQWGKVEGEGGVLGSEVEPAEGLEVEPAVGPEVEPAGCLEDGNWGRTAAVYGLGASGVAC